MMHKLRMFIKSYMRFGINSQSQWHSQQHNDDTGVALQLQYVTSVCISHLLIKYTRF